MNNDRHLQLMRNLYTALQAETMARYGKAGIVPEIEEEKRGQSLASGAKNAQMLGVSEPEEAFSVPAAITECASWDIVSMDNGLSATCRGCRLIGMCKAVSTPSPCRMYCLNPIRGMVEALRPGARFEVQSTLWESDRCHVEVRW